MKLGYFHSPVNASISTRSATFTLYIRSTFALLSGWVGYEWRSRTRYRQIHTTMYLEAENPIPTTHRLSFDLCICWGPVFLLQQQGVRRCRVEKGLGFLIVFFWLSDYRISRRLVQRVDGWGEASMQERQ